MDTLKSLEPNYYFNKAIGSDGFIEKLYKFFSFKELDINEHLFKSIASNYFWHASPEHFNDPFDCYNELIDYYPTDEATKQISEALLIKGTNDVESGDLKNQIANAYKHTAVVQGICCFTKIQTSNLMWSHYANNHYGVCLAFDHKALFDYGLRMYKVAYETTFKSTNYFSPTEDALLCKFTTKSFEWDYEKEYRSINDVVGGVEFPKSALLSITFGCKTTPEAITYIQQLLFDNGYKDILYYQAKMQRGSFDLAIEPLI